MLFDCQWNNVGYDDDDVPRILKNSLSNMLKLSINTTTVAIHLGIINVYKGKKW